MTSVPGGSSCSPLPSPSSSPPVPPSPDPLTSQQRMFAASTGAICTALFMTPLDVVKIRLQNQLHPVNTGECFIYSNGLMDHLCRACAKPKTKVPCEWYERPGNFTGTLDALIRIPRQEGIRSLWSGLLPTLVMAVPLTVFYFSAYDCLLSRLRTRFALWNGGDPLSAHLQCLPISPAHPFPPSVSSSVHVRGEPRGGTLENVLAPVLAGVIARSASVTLVAPLEVVRTKMQSEHMSVSHIGEAIRSSLNTHGWRGLYLGWIPTLWRDVPFSAMYWALYESIKSRLIRMRGASEVDFVTAFASGALSGAIASIITNPFDVVKTRRQIELGRELDKEEATSMRRERMLAVMRRMAREKGITSLWAGIVPRVLKVAPACAIMIGSYEYFKAHFAKVNRASALDSQH